MSSTIDQHFFARIFGIRRNSVTILISFSNPRNMLKTKFIRNSFLFILLIIPALLAGCGPVEEVKVEEEMVTEWQVYTNPEHQLTLKYPPNWVEDPFTRSKNTEYQLFSASEPFLVGGIGDSTPLYLYVQTYRNEEYVPPIVEDYLEPGTFVVPEIDKVMIVDREVERAKYVNGATEGAISTSYFIEYERMGTTYLFKFGYNLLSCEYFILHPTKKDCKLDMSQIEHSNIALMDEIIESISFSFDLVYPEEILSLSREGDKVILSHEVEHWHSDMCSNRSGLNPVRLPSIVDFKASFEVVGLDLKGTLIKSGNGYIVSKYMESGEVDFDKVHEAYPPELKHHPVNSVEVGEIKGYSVTSSSHGCGIIDYYFPIDDTKTLLVTRNLVPEFNPITSLSEFYMKVPGVILPEKADEMFKSILNNLKI